MHRLGVIVFALSSMCAVRAQIDVFGLQSRQYTNKPTVAPEYSKYFELDGHARELVDSLVGPRPGGFLGVLVSYFGLNNGYLTNYHQFIHIFNFLARKDI
jgi:hypothetical protein